MRPWTDAHLELTPRGIPVSLRPFFQEYRLEDLDPDRNAYTVIERTLAWGDVLEARWLFGLYGPDRLRQWVREYGWYGLPRRQFRFWLCVLDIQEYRQGERIWPH